MNNISLNDINISATQTLDRYHLNKLNISFNNQQIVNLNNEEKDIEEWTVDQDTAFHIGWDLNIIPQIKHLCIQQGQKVFFKSIYIKIKRFFFKFSYILNTIIIKRNHFILI
jgi:poly(A) polymerase Pap1